MNVIEAFIVGGLVGVAVGFCVPFALYSISESFKRR